jgi:S-adenosylmethionine hydrolase
LSLDALLTENPGRAKLGAVIYLFTDFGSSDLYVGQVKARLESVAPGVPVIDLLHDAPAYRVQASAHLLSALASEQPSGSVTLAVVDPGVGTARKPVVLRADGAWFVGPDNGLLSVLAARSRLAEVYEIVWRPSSMSRSFHGRDLFAPIAGGIAASGLAETLIRPAATLEVAFDAGDFGEIVYVDHYGNAMTGLRGRYADCTRVLSAGGTAVRFASVFAEAASSEAFWYVNSIGLVEIAINRGSAAEALGLSVGDGVRWSR